MKTMRCYSRRKFLTGAGIAAGAAAANIAYRSQSRPIFCKGLPIHPIASPMLAI